MRSYSGCFTCRKRKLKCDEIKPLCGHCRKGKRDCIFKERVVFRNLSYQSQLSPKDKGRDPSCDREEPLFEENHVWLGVPTELTFVQVNDPYDFDDLAERQPEKEQDDQDSAAPTQEHANSHDSPQQGEYASLDREFMSMRTPINNNNDRNDLFARSNPKHDAYENIVALCLLRHFKEGPGQWMDAFDSGAYFSQKVPIKATTRPLLKAATCALAAKHLHHLHHSQASGQVNSSLLRTSIPLFLGQAPDWQYQSAKHYDRAICHLKDAVEGGGFETDITDKEEIFAAIAILSTYELMNAPGTAWRAHLSALPLFSPGPEHASTPCSPIAIPRAPITGPVFWSLARQDLSCAFISETQMRLDPKDIRLWRNAGLATDVDGFLIPSGPFDIHATADIEEDTRSNELTWLLGKIANIITSGDALVPENYALPAGQRPLVGVTQEHLLDRWMLVATELQVWRDRLPGSFTPSARIICSLLPGDKNLGKFEQIWYEAPICAATMQSYHMACILLLVNQPHESTAVRSTVSARLKSYRGIESEALYHARELCGISLASPPDPVRINSVQPLSVAGQVFHEEDDLHVVLDLLSGIEADLGWTTRHHTSNIAGLLEGNRHAIKRSRIFT